MWEWIPADEAYLMHYGVLGMKWGVRKQRESNGKGRSSNPEYAIESSKKPILNSDGSTTFPKGFVFNRIGKQKLDINESGVLYVSNGKDDASRYTKSLGPSLFGRLTGNYGDTVQHLTVDSDIKMASNKDVVIGMAKVLKNDSKIFESFKDSVFSMTMSDDPFEDITSEHIDRAIKNPTGIDGQRLAFSVGAMLGNPNYVSEAKSIYSHFKENGYDAIPDIYDQYSGTSKTATIIINTQKISMSSKTEITKDIYKEAKAYVKSLEKLPVNDLFD